MNNQLSMPDPEKVKQTVARSRRRRLEIEIVGLELEEAIAQLEHHNRQKRLQRLRQVLGNSAMTESKPSEPNLEEVSS
jgi:Mn-dependent DtxR family transcriptional regulator